MTHFEKKDVELHSGGVHYEKMGAELHSGGVHYEKMEAVLHSGVGHCEKVGAELHSGVSYYEKRLQYDIVFGRVDFKGRGSGWFFATQKEGNVNCWDLAVYCLVPA